MGKAHRGRPARSEFSGSARGTCPITKRSGVKLMYEHEVEGEKIKVSKAGKATLANAQKRKLKKEKQLEQAASE